MMKIKVTKDIPEKWYKFTRYEFKKNGHIDWWFGDSANNPNNGNKANYCLNSNAHFFRLNDGTWEHGNNFDRYFHVTLNNESKLLYPTLDAKMFYEFFH